MPFEEPTKTQTARLMTQDLYGCWCSTYIGKHQLSGIKKKVNPKHHKIVLNFFVALNDQLEFITNTLKRLKLSCKKKRLKANVLTRLLKPDNYELGDCLDLIAKKGNELEVC